MRNRYFDVLKAIAIIAVVLYHLGICEYGYLGVDIFLVIAGFFTSQSVEKHVVNKGGYLWFVENRVFRLWRLLLLAGVMCLGWGWLGARAETARVLTAVRLVVQRSRCGGYRYSSAAR